MRPPQVVIAGAVSQCNRRTPERRALPGKTGRDNAGTKMVSVGARADRCDEPGRQPTQVAVRVVISPHHAGNVTGGGGHRLPDAEAVNPKFPGRAALEDGVGVGVSVVRGCNGVSVVGDPGIVGSGGCQRIRPQRRRSTGRHSNGSAAQRNHATAAHGRVVRQREQPTPSDPATAALYIDFKCVLTS